jgi:hypothetical protein
MEVEMRERNARKAGVAMGDWVWGFEIGIVGEDILAARESNRRGCGKGVEVARRSLLQERMQ